MRALLRACASAFVMTLKMSVVSSWTYLTWIIFPLIVAAVGLQLLSHSSAPGHDAYAALGGGLIGYWGAAYLDAGGSINRERWEGTLESLLALPTPLPVVVVGKTLAALCLGALSFIPAFGLAYIGFRVLPPEVAPLPFIVSFMVLSFSFFAVAITLAPLYTLWRWAFSISNGFELGLYALGGFLFPIDRLPGWLQGASWLLPPSWATRALYRAAGGGGPADYVAWWALAVGSSLVLIVLSRILFGIVETRSRVTGQMATA